MIIWFIPVQSCWKMWTDEFVFLSPPPPPPSLPPPPLRPDHCTDAQFSLIFDSFFLYSCVAFSSFPSTRFQYAHAHIATSETNDRWWWWWSLLTDIHFWTLDLSFSLVLSLSCFSSFNFPFRWFSSSSLECLFDEIDIDALVWIFSSFDRTCRSTDYRTWQIIDDRQ